MRQDDFEIFHRIDSAPGFISPHSHDFFEIYFPRCSNVSYIVEGQRYKLSPGTLVLIAPGEVHWSEVDEPGDIVERFVLWLNTSFLESLVGLLPRFRNLLGVGLKGRHMIVPDPETYELMLGLLHSLLHEKRLNDLDSASLNRLVVAQLMIHISRVLSNTSSGVSDHAAQRHNEIMRVYEYIAAHLKESLSVSDLAEHFFMDKNTLTRHFKHVTGMTPAECVRRKRLDAAYTMITHGSGITEACHECGFADYSAFYRAFRQVYGLSPSDCAVQRQHGVRLQSSAE